MGTMTDEEYLKEFRRTFLSETKFMLEECEDSFMRLEQNEDRTEILNRIFRLFHTIKGSAASVGFTELSNFAHGAEELLVLLRETPALVDFGVVSLLLEVNDLLKDWTLRLSVDDQCASPAWQDLNQRVLACAEAMRAQVDGFFPLGDNEGGLFLSDDELKRLRAGSKPGVAADNGTPGGAAGAGMDTPQTTTPSSPGPSAAPTPAATADTTAASKPATAGGAGEVLKIDARRIDAVLDLVGEMVVIKSQLLENRALKARGDDSLQSLVGLLDKAVRELQDRALALRMTSMRTTFLKLTRTVRDLSAKLGKPVEFLTHGEDTEIDRTIIEALADPLMHICRNAIDHGIEKESVRAARGKPSRGTISLSAGSQGGRIYIDVRDDGGGIERERVIDKAKKQGLLPAGEDLSRWSDRQVFELLFLPGFSTAEVLTEVSGRGVGLDVVRDNIRKVKGEVEIESAAGVGSCFRLWIPLTTAIADAMLVEVEGATYIMPMEVISELLEARTVTVSKSSVDTEIVRVRDQIVPLVRTRGLLPRRRSQQLAMGDASAAPEVIIIVEHNSHKLALLVDRVVGQSQVVVKALGPDFRNADGVAGAVILGNGSVGLMLDVSHFFAGRAVSRAAAGNA